MSPIFLIGQKCTGAGQAVCWHHMAAVEVEQRGDREVDTGGHSHGKSPSCKEAS